MMRNESRRQKEPEEDKEGVRNISSGRQRHTSSKKQAAQSTSIRQ
jgi:hypothetical protein